MDLKTEIKKELEKYNISPRKYLGQNFLISTWVYKKILEAANLSLEDKVLEVGAGLGYLTLLLSQKCKKVIAVEKDREIFKVLVEKTKTRKNIVCIRTDVRKFNPEESELKIKKYKIVANLPYYLTSFFLKIFLEKYPPRKMTLLIQKEVAEKIIATNKKESILSLSVKFFAEPQIIAFTGKENFWPQPKIDSAILNLNLRERLLFNNKKLFFEILKLGFSHNRKKLISNLSSQFPKETILKIFRAINAPANCRPEDLSLSQWISLTRFFSFVKIKK